MIVVVDVPGVGRDTVRVDRAQANTVGELKRFVAATAACDPFGVKIHFPAKDQPLPGLDEINVGDLSPPQLGHMELPAAIEWVYALVPRRAAAAHGPARAHALDRAYILGKVMVAGFEEKQEPAADNGSYLGDKAFWGAVRAFRSIHVIKDYRASEIRAIFGRSAFDEFMQHAPADKVQTLNEFVEYKLRGEATHDCGEPATKRSWREGSSH